MYSLSVMVFLYYLKHFLIDFDDFLLNIYSLIVAALESKPVILLCNIFHLLKIYFDLMCQAFLAKIFQLNWI